MTYHKVSVLDGGLVVHGAEVVLTESQDHQLLEEAVTHHELFGGTRDVPVVVEDTHTCETCDLHLQSHVLAQVNIDLGLARGVGTNICCSHEGGSETLVPNLVNHYSKQLLIINIYYPSKLLCFF